MLKQKGYYFIVVEKIYLNCPLLLLAAVANGKIRLEVKIILPKILFSNKMDFPLNYTMGSNYKNCRLRNESLKLYISFI